MDLKSAFRLLPVYHGDFDLLCFKIVEKFYIEKCIPMGCSVSCATFERFSTCLHWVIKNKSGSKNIDHYLDDFLFGGIKDTNECKNLMLQFEKICSEIGVLVVNEKTEGPSTIIEYLGLTIDTVNMLIKNPEKKVQDLLKKIKLFSYGKKVTLKELQSMCGSLAFCAKALPAGRSFSRRLYMVTTKASKPHHFIRITTGMRNDLLMWKMFLEVEWMSNVELELYAYSAGAIGKGCAAYLQGKWAYLKWPKEWSGNDILRDDLS